MHVDDFQVIAVNGRPYARVFRLAFLYLDGKLDAPTPSAVADRVTAATQALLTATRADALAAAAG